MKKSSPLKHKGSHIPYTSAEDFHKAQGGVHNGVDYGAPSENLKQREEEEKIAVTAKKAATTAAAASEKTKDEGVGGIPYGEGSWKRNFGLPSELEVDMTESETKMKSTFELLGIAMQPYEQSGVDDDGYKYSEEELGKIKKRLYNKIRSESTESGELSWLHNLKGQTPKWKKRIDATRPPLEKEEDLTLFKAFVNKYYPESSSKEEGWDDKWEEAYNQHSKEFKDDLSTEGSWTSSYRKELNPEIELLYEKPKTNDRAQDWFYIKENPKLIGVDKLDDRVREAVKDYEGITESMTEGEKDSDYFYSGGYWINPNSGKTARFNRNFENPAYLGVYSPNRLEGDSNYVDNLDKPFGHNNTTLSKLNKNSIIKGPDWDYYTHLLRYQSSDNLQRVQANANLLAYGAALNSAHETSAKEYLKNKYGVVKTKDGETRELTKDEYIARILGAGVFYEKKDQPFFNWNDAFGATHDSDIDLLQEGVNRTKAIVPTGPHSMAGEVYDPMSMSVRDLKTEEKWTYEDVGGSGAVNEYLFGDVVRGHAPWTFREAKDEFYDWLAFLDPENKTTLDRTYAEDIIINSLNNSGIMKDLQDAYVGEKASEKYLNKYLNLKSTNVDLKTDLDVETAIDNEVVEQLTNYLTKEQKIIRQLFKNGDFKKGEEALKKSGHIMLYRKDGKLINWDLVGDKTKKEEIEADFPNTMIQDTKIEEEAQEKAYVGLDVLKESRKNKYFEALAMVDLLNRYGGDYRTEAGTLTKEDMDMESGLDPFYGAESIWTNFIPYLGNEEERRMFKLKNAIEETIKTGKIENGLSQISGDHPMAKKWNEIWEELLILNRAIEVNMDPSYLAEESAWYVIPWAEKLFSKGEFQNMTTDKQVETTIKLFEELGFEQTEDGKKIKRAGGDWWGKGGLKIPGFGEFEAREVIEGGSNFIEEIAPLIAGMFGPRKAVNTTKVFKYLQKAIVNGSKSPTRRRMATLVTGMTKELTLLTAGDLVAQATLGTEAMFVDLNKKKWDVAFGLGLGAGNVLGGWLFKGLSGSKFFSPIFAKTQKIKTLDAAIKKNFGAGAGVGSLEIAKVMSGNSELVDLLFQDIDYSKWKEEGFNSEKEYRKHIEDRNYEIKHELMKHWGSDYLGMLTLGVFQPGSGIKRAIEKDLKNFEIKVFKTSDATRVLDVKEGSSYEAIENARREKEAKATEKYTGKELDSAIKKIKKAAEDLHFRNELSEIKKTIKNEEKKLKNFEGKAFTIGSKIQRGKRLTAQEKVDIAKMTDAQFKYFLLKLGGEKMLPKEIGDHLTENRELYKDIMKEVGRLQVDNKKDRNKYIDQVEELMMMRWRLKTLSDPKNNKNGKNNTEIEQLKEKLKAAEKSYLEIAKKLEGQFEAKVKRELKVAAVIARELGAEFEVVEEEYEYNGKKYTKKALEDLRVSNKKLYDKIIKDGKEISIEQNYIDKGGEKNTAGFYEVVDGVGRIVVNPETALKARTLGTGIHEIVHHILKDAFKEVYQYDHNGKKYSKAYVEELKNTNKKLHDKIKKEGTAETRMTDEGVAIIKKFLDGLDAKERSWLENKIDKKYRYKEFKGEDGKTIILDKTGKKRAELNERDYYEEYLSHYVEGIKNKEIKYDASRARKIMDVVIPLVNKVFPNVGKGIGKEYNIKNAEGLKNMLIDLYSMSERGVAKYEMKNFISRNAEKIARESLKVLNKKAFSTVEMERINKVGERYTREQWKGPDSDPMSGKWREGYEEILPDLVKVVRKKVDRFARKTGLIKNGLNVEDFTWRVIEEVGGMGEGQRKFGGHVLNFDINKKTYEGGGFGLSGWINKQINNKLYNILKKPGAGIKDFREISISDEKFKELVSEEPGPTEIIERDVTNEMIGEIVDKSKLVKLHESIYEINKGKGELATQINRDVKDIFTLKNGEINEAKLRDFVKGKNYKNLPGLTTEKTAQLFTGNRTYTADGPGGGAIVKAGLVGKPIHIEIARKIKENANLNQQDIFAVQPVLDRLMPLIFDVVIPEGFITKGVPYIERGVRKIKQVPAKTTGVPNVILEITHNKRSVAGETTITGKRVRTKENFFGQYKKTTDIPKVVENLRESVGVNKDGTRSSEPRNIKDAEGNIIVRGKSQQVKALLQLTDKMFTNQGTRELLDALGKPFESFMLSIGDGKATKAWSKVELEKPLHELILSMEINPVETGRLVGEIIKSKDKLTESQFENYKINNGEIVELVDKFMEGKGEVGVRFNQSVKRSEYTPDVVKEYISEGGIVEPKARLTEINNQITFNEKTIEVIGKMHPIAVENLSKHKHEFGYKDGKGAVHPNAEHLIVKPSEMFSKLTKVQADALKYRMKKKGIHLDAIPNSIAMLKKTTKVKNALDILYTNKIAEGGKIATVKEKLEAFEKLVPEIKEWNSGNENLFKYIVETEKMLYRKGELPPEYVHLQNQLHTSIVEGRRALSTWKFHYVVDGKMIAEKSMPYTKPPKDWKGTKQEYYDSDPFKDWIKNDWGKTTEWKERYEVNLKDPATKAGAIRKGISPKTNAIIRTIEDLSIGNEHVEALATTNGIAADYVYSNGKYGSLDVMAGGHATVWAPNYIRNRLDAPIVVDGTKVNNRINLEGEFRLTRYLKDGLKYENIYTLDGQPVLEYLSQKSGFAKELKQSIETVKSNNKAINPLVSKKYSKVDVKNSDIIKDLTTIDKAIDIGRKFFKKKQGISVWDFDDTIATTKSKIGFTRPDGTKGKLSAEEYAKDYVRLAKKGYEFDFSEFDIVKEGKRGPFFEKAQNRIKKFGNKHQYILTARPPAAQQAIYVWMSKMGLKIPKENITALGNSTAEAKAMWMLEKYTEGYNDFYFADDAIQNVKEVKSVLDQLDVKSKVQQAKQFSKVDLSKRFNEILEESTGVEAYKTYSEAKAKMVGKGKGWYKHLVGGPTMEDFSGLVGYSFSGKGRKGEADIKWFDDNLQKPFNRAYNDIHNRKQTITNDYKALRKQTPEITRSLNKKVDGIYNVDNAIRVYLFDKAGYELPGLSKTDLNKLTSFVRNNTDVLAFAENISKITKTKEGYIKPNDYWLGENITMDLNNVVDRVYRKEALGEFLENRRAIFGRWENGKLTGKNMNKIEAIFGSKHRMALENMLWRMENGTNRSIGKDHVANRWMNWVNSATGTIMFFNQKSAVLQTISTLNYVNGTFNNPYRAGQAFANQKQYWTDFATIWNSDMLVQRRAGLKINVEAAEMITRVGASKDKASAALAYLLQKGFIPTKYADSFAIALGGATYYRNSIRKYKKQGMSQEKAEKQAWEDFTQMTEATQQSSRPDLISMQQASAIGRPILAFANTPIQMFRRHKRRIQDIANGRGNMAENIGSALYYGFAQTVLFSFLANAMFAVDDESEDPEDKAFSERQKSRHINTVADSYLRGMGTPGATVAALKNGIVRFMAEDEKGYHADYGNVVVDLLNVSPPIGSKARKVYQALKTWKWNEDVIKEMGFDIDNPANLALAKVISAVFNVPVDRLAMKVQNIRDAAYGDFETWQRVAMVMGWNKWMLGTEGGPSEEKIKKVEEEIEERKKLEKEVEKQQVKEEELREEYPGKTDSEIEKIIKLEEKNKEFFSLNKSEQVRVLKQLGLSDSRIKELKKEQDRVNKIMDMYDRNPEKVEKALKAQKDYKPSDQEKRYIDVFKMNKKDQVNLLMSLGLSGKQIKTLKYEEDRVKMIILLEEKWEKEKKRSQLRRQ